MDLDGIWTGFLDLLGEVLVPTWNDLIQYIPLLIGLLLVLSIAGLAWYWRRNATVNRPRVPRPIPSGRKPDDLHLPGPSLWPFVAPLGLLLLGFSVAVGPFSSIFTMALLALGVGVILVGIAGWYLDANREYVSVEAGGHALEAGPMGGPPAWSLQPPEGMHLPGPSAWPFLAPVGLFFAVAGLIFGPALIIGGLLMGAIAAIGWLLDAGGELADVEAHGHPSQADRDPEKAWPRRLIPIYVFIGGVAVLLTLAPWLLSLLPGSG